MVSEIYNNDLSDTLYNLYKPMERLVGTGKSWKMPEGSELKLSSLFADNVMLYDEFKKRACVSTSPDMFNWRLNVWHMHTMADRLVIENIGKPHDCFDPLQVNAYECETRVAEFTSIRYILFSFNDVFFGIDLYTGEVYAVKKEKYMAFTPIGDIKRAFGLDNTEEEKCQ